MFSLKPTQSKTRYVIDILILIILIGTGIAYKNTIEKFVREQYNTIRPCSLPIVYAIGNIDPQFGVSRADFTNDISKAIAIWEKPMGKQLFAFASSTADADILVNLEYDSRQQTTTELQKIDSVIQSSNAEFNTLKAKYEAELASYNSDKQAFESLVAAYQTEKNHTKNEFDVIQQKQTALNAEATTLNTTASQLNAVIKDHNLNVRTYNAVGATTGESFEEGVYESTATGKDITIFQFDNQTKFIRVLAHEFGHALGLGHLPNPSAIMYKVNADVNLSLTADDLSALQAICK